MDETLASCNSGLKMDSNREKFAGNAKLKDIRA
jgi:hypothetical protein